MPATYSLVRTVEPMDEPVTEMDVQDHSRIPSTDDTQIYRIQQFIMQARERVETDCNIALITQQWRLSLPRWERVITLDRPPLVSVETITYLDVDGVEQVVPSTDYRVHTDSYPGKVSLAPDAQWPEVEQGAYLPISIAYTCGYNRSIDPAFPQRASQAILMLIDHWYTHRGIGVTGATFNQLPDGYAELVQSLKVGEYSRALQ